LNRPGVSEGSELAEAIQHRATARPVVCHQIEPAVRTLAAPAPLGQVQPDARAVSNRGQRTQRRRTPRPPQPARHKWPAVPPRAIIRVCHWRCARRRWPKISILRAP